VLQTHPADVKKEMQIMLHLAGHKNIVGLQEAFEDPVYVHLVLELCEGGELVDRITRKGR
jgi:calcium-dependent protein kinase